MCFTRKTKHFNKLLRWCNKSNKNNSSVFKISNMQCLTTAHTKNFFTCKLYIERSLKIPAFSVLHHAYILWTSECQNEKCKYTLIVFRNFEKLKRHLLFNWSRLSLKNGWWGWKALKYLQQYICLYMPFFSPKPTCMNNIIFSWNACVCVCRWVKSWKTKGNEKGR